MVIGRSPASAGQVWCMSIIQSFWYIVLDDPTIARYIPASLVKPAAKPAAVEVVVVVIRQPKTHVRL